MLFWQALAANKDCCRRMWKEWTPCCSPTPNQLPNWWDSVTMENQCKQGQKFLKLKAPLESYKTSTLTNLCFRGETFPAISHCPWPFTDKKPLMTQLFNKARGQNVKWSRRTVAKSASTCLSLSHTVVIVQLEYSTASPLTTPAHATITTTQGGKTCVNRKNWNVKGK